MSSYLFMRIETRSGLSVGPIRAAILEGIDRFGSISASARAVGMTTRQVWSIVKLLNQTFPQPLVDVRAGGRQSGASLTAYGAELMGQFRKMEQDAAVALRPHFEAFDRLFGEDPGSPPYIPRPAEVIDPVTIPPSGKS